MEKTIIEKYEEMINGFKGFVLSEIRSEIGIRYFTGRYDQSGQLFKEPEQFNKIVNDIYDEWFPTFERSVELVIDRNEELKRFSLVS